MTSAYASLPARPFCRVYLRYDAANISIVADVEIFQEDFENVVGIEQITFVEIVFWMTAAIADPLQGTDPLGIVQISSFVNFDTTVQWNKATALGIPGVDTGVCKDFLDALPEMICCCT